MQSKTCTRCGEEKPISEFYESKKQGKVHYQGKCKQCFNRTNQEKLESDAAKHQAKIEYKRKWNAENKEKLQEYQRKRAEYCEKNPKRPALTEEEKAQRRKETLRRANQKRQERKRQQRVAEKQQQAAGEQVTGRKCKKCGETKPLDDYYVRGGYRLYSCKPCANKNNTAYMKRRLWTDPEFLESKRHYRNLSHARRKGATGTHSPSQWKQLKQQHGYRCLCCGRQEPEVKLTRDHILPVAMGGTNDIENIQPLCGKCNSTKNAKHISYT